MKVPEAGHVIAVQIVDRALLVGFVLKMLA